MNTEALIRKLDELYGPNEGMRVYLTIMPGVLSDFQKMLESAPVGKTITEEYCLEDGKGTLVMTGRRDAAGNPTIDAVMR